MKLTEHEFAALTGFIQRNYGINLGRKKELVESRLFGLLSRRGYQSFSEYMNHVRSDRSGEEMANLLNLITTNHTFFFREPRHFEFMSGEVLPWLANNVPSRDLRIWSAGCSTGEEAYTLAMVLDRFFGSRSVSWDTQILGTDISTRAIRHAQEGCYSGQSISQMPADMLRRYFEHIGSDRFRVCERIRSQVIFRRFNLMAREFPFRRKFHVIFCRNVMIYFDQPTKNALVNRFYEMTEPGGYLFIGHSEALEREETMYRYIMPAVYRKPAGILQ
ncbi:MAG: protein-glutamate O-methyltransferase CheR [Clostridiales bacterium]|nr:protein-glutamate O-methyltransferase CheR [Clostridiales bacterium]